MHLLFVYVACVLLLALVWFVLPLVVVIALLPLGAGLAGVDTVRRRRQWAKWRRTIPADNPFWGRGGRRD